MEPFSGMWLIYLGPYTQGIIVPQVGVKACKLLPPPQWRIDCFVLKQATMAPMSLWEHWTCPVQKTRFWPDPPWTLALAIFLFLLPWWFLSLGRWDDGQMPYLWTNTPQTFPLRTILLWVPSFPTHTEQRCFFLMRADSCTNLWVSRYRSRVQLDAMSI